MNLPGDYKGHDWEITSQAYPVSGDVVARCNTCGATADLDTYMAASYGHCVLLRYIRCTCGARACGYGNSGAGHAHHCLGRGTEADIDEPLELNYALGYNPAYGP